MLIGNRIKIFYEITLRSRKIKDVKFPFFRSLKTKLFLTIAGLLTVALFSSLFIYYEITIDTLFKKDLTEVKTSSLVIADQFAGHFFTDGTEPQEALQLILRTYKSVDKLTTFDYKTTVLASTLNSDIGKKTELKDHLQVLKNGEINIETYREKDRGTFARAVVPIFSHSHGNEKTILGGMEIVFHLEEFDKAALQIKRTFGIILICFLGLAICAALFASYQFTNPLFKLRDGLTEVSKGNLDHHFDGRR